MAFDVFLPGCAADFPDVTSLFSRLLPAWLDSFRHLDHTIDTHHRYYRGRRHGWGTKERVEGRREEETGGLERRQR